MDPMDYTMDSGQPAQNQNTAHQCQYQPPHQSSISNTFAPQARDAHHYDPVHNTESWYQANGNGAQSRPPYSAQQNVSQWGPGQHVPVNSWHGFGEARAGSQGSDRTSYRQQTGFMGMPNSPWNEMRGYEPLPFGYNVYGNNGASAEPAIAGRGSIAASTPAAATPQMPQQNIAALQAEFARRANRASNSGNGSEDVHALRAAARVVRAREDRAFQTQPLRSFDYPHTHTSQDPSRLRRRNANNWDSDDDDDSVPELEIDSYHRSSELLFNDMDEERHMAAVRGAIAAGKKVPSKEFIASLEKLDPKDLKEADRTCMICYNEFGVQNPDGILEHPIRLPKCRHLFGDKCIKKWFEDSDSCPYCRDKLPSELSARKTIALDALQQARRERLAVAAAAGQGHGYRSRHGFPPRYPSSEEVVHGNASNYFRHTQEEYHYIMRGSLPPDPWSYSPPNRSSPRESPENRRRQSRGRVGLGRPTSVGSARFITPTTSHQNAQRTHLQSITPNSHGSFPTPRRSATPGLPRQNSVGSSGSTTQTPPARNRLSAASSSSEEASPPVAVGSGIAAALQNRPASFSNYMPNQWADPFGTFLNHGETTYFPQGRTPNMRIDMDQSGGAASFEPRPTDADQSQPSMADVNLPARPGNFHEAMNGNPQPRWSR